MTRSDSTSYSETPPPDEPMARIDGDVGLNAIPLAASGRDSASPRSRPLGAPRRAPAPADRRRRAASRPVRGRPGSAPPREPRSRPGEPRGLASMSQKTAAVGSPTTSVPSGAKPARPSGDGGSGTSSDASVATSHSCSTPAPVARTNWSWPGRKKTLTHSVPGTGDRLGRPCLRHRAAARRCRGRGSVRDVRRR